MTRKPNLTIAYTPDSDDAFYYFALERGRVRLRGYEPAFHRAPIATLNRAALRGRYDVTAVSSVVYPRIADRYAILSVGTSVGRGYGPVLVSKRCREIADLDGRTVGVGGVPTTGWFLLRWLCPGARVVAMEFDRIADAVARGALDAGVMIHEELLYYPRLGLRRVVDLGAEWCTRTGLPLPVGLNVIRRDLGGRVAERVCAAIRRSLRYALAYRGDVLEAVRGFGRGRHARCTAPFVSMFANQDSLAMPRDVRLALQRLFVELARSGVCESVPAIDVIEGAARRRSRAAARVI